MTVGDCDCPEIVIIIVIVAMDAERCRIGMEKMGSKLQFCHDLEDDFIKKVSGPVFIDPVQRA